MAAHRDHLWEKFYNSVCESIGDNHSWELIMVGPRKPPEFFSDKKNCQFVHDLGAPARCAQRATTLATGELMMWAADDGIFTKGSISRCVDAHDSLSRKDGIALKYTEGRNYGGAPMHNDYWIAHHHPPMRLTSIPRDFKIILLGMVKLDYFREIGGFDCRFEHLNMNLHDLSFRIQRDGGVIHVSDDIVCNHDWNPVEGDHLSVHEAFEKNDLPLFTQLYTSADAQRINIEYENWKNSPEVWQRRFGNK